MLEPVPGKPGEFILPDGTRLFLSEVYDSIRRIESEQVLRVPADEKWLIGAIYAVTTVHHQLGTPTAQEVWLHTGAGDPYGPQNIGTLLDHHWLITRGLEQPWQTPTGRVLTITDHCLRLPILVVGGRNIRLECRPSLPRYTFELRFAVERPAT